jgi:hypothetical protein
VTIVLNPAPANPNHFASSEAHALVSIDLRYSALLKGGPAYFPGHRFPLPASLARLNTTHRPHFQALFFFRALKFHTLKIVRGI